MPTPAPAITAIPDFPSLADRATYNAKAFAWATSLKTATAPELAALGTNIYNNAVEGAASATTAGTKAGEASTSASTATTQASTATAQATASGVSAAASEASRIAGSKSNLGSKTSDPALDNQGSALLTGALYFNTTSNGTRIYNGVSWQSAAGVVSPNFTILRETQTATAGQTVFNLVNSYIVGTNAVMIYINGVRQFADAYVETNSTTITFTGPLSVGDSVLFEAGVTAVGTNVAAGNVTFSPAGGVAATNVQAAIAELGARVVAGKGANIFTGVQDYATGAALPSTATVNLDTATGNRVHITGTTAITAVTLTRGPRTVIFDGVLTLTHNATSNNLPGAANITTAAGDRAIYESDGTTVYCVSYVPVSGKAVINPVATATASGLVPTPPNDATKVLSGAMTYITPASGALVHLATINPINAASAVFNSGISNTYEEYLIRGNLVQVGGASYGTFNLDFSNNSGASYLATTVNFFNFRCASNGAVSATSGTDVGSAILESNVYGTEYSHLEINFTRNSSGLSGLSFGSQAQGYSTPSFQSGQFRCASTTINALKLYFNASNMTGSLSLYGIRKV